MATAFYSANASPARTRAELTTAPSRENLLSRRFIPSKISVTQLPLTTPTFGLFEFYAGHSPTGMKYYLILTLAVVLALPTITLAKEKGPGATADVEATVKKIEQEILDGILKSDTSALEKYLTSDYLGIGPDGATQNKSEFLSDVKSGALKLESSKESEMKVQVADPDMAVVLYRTNDKGTYKGKDITGEYRWLDVFVKRGGKWQVAIDQGTQIAKQ
jgi:hypothetical protein